MEQIKQKEKQQEQALSSCSEQARLQRYRNDCGQAMILTMLVLSSTVLSLAAVGGYFMLIRLRASADIVSTTKALYIADAGIECEAYNQFKGSKDPAFCFAADRNRFLYNNAVADPNDTYTTTSTSSYIQAVGSFHNSNRAFRMDF